MQAGGFSAVKEVTPEIQAKADHVRADVETKLGKKFKNFTVTKYKEQVVAGKNYKMTVQVDDDDYDYVHIVVYETLPHAGSKLSLTSAEGGKTCCDDL